MNGEFYLIRFAGTSSFTDFEKESVWETILKMIELIKIVRREGLLYLDNVADRENDVFLRGCIDGGE